jgi:hypothetical protein
MDLLTMVRLSPMLEIDFRSTILKSMLDSIPMIMVKGLVSACQ